MRRLILHPYSIRSIPIPMSYMEQLKIQIPKELLSPSESIHLEGEVELSPMQKGTDEYTFAEPAQWKADITNTGGALLVAGSVSVRAKTQCARCLCDAYVMIDGEIEGYFLLSSQSESQDEMEDLDYEILPDDKRIDMMPLIRAAIMLELPLVPICRDDCRGLCSMCGANLNEGECGCEKQTSKATGANNPFGVLADLDLN